MPRPDISTADARTKIKFYKLLQSGDPVAALDCAKQHGYWVHELGQLAPLHARYAQLEGGDRDSFFAWRREFFGGLAWQQEELALKRYRVFARWAAETSSEDDQRELERRQAARQSELRSAAVAEEAERELARLEDELRRRARENAEKNTPPGALPRTIPRPPEPPMVVIDVDGPRQFR